MGLHVKRDPFARGEYVRFSLGARTCHWCGQKRKRAYNYAWADDQRADPTAPYDGYAFCNWQCYATFHGL